MRFLQKLCQLLLNTLFPPVCAFCKSEGDFLCKNCVHKISKKRVPPFSCKNESEFKNLKGLIYGVGYAENPIIKVALRQFKYKFNQELADYFSEILSEKIGELSMTSDRSIILIPIPLHKKRLNERGFNQSEVLANHLAKQCPEVQVLNLLLRDRYTGQQAKLDRESRHKNLQNAFSLNKKFVHKYSSKNLYFIIDDVCTTGATIESGAGVLKKNGFEKIYGLVVARAFK